MPTEEITRGSWPSDYEAVVKSIGLGITCTSDLVSELEVRQVLLELSQEIGKKLRDTKLAAGGVRICVRDNTLHHREYQTRLPFPTQSFLELTEAGIQAFPSQVHLEQSYPVIDHQCY